MCLGEVYEALSENQSAKEWYRKAYDIKNDCDRTIHALYRLQVAAANAAKLAESGQ